MESPIAVFKLIILYMLDRAGGPIAMPQISAFLLENGYTDFNSLFNTYASIVANGFVTSKEEGDKTFLTITEEGRNALRYFGSEISKETCRQIEEFLRDNGRQIRNDEDIIAEYYRSTYGSYMAHLVVRDKREPMLEISLSVPDEESAKAVTAGWKDKSADIYRMILEQLY